MGRRAPLSGRQPAPARKRRPAGGEVFAVRLGGVELRGYALGDDSLKLREGIFIAEPPLYLGEQHGVGCDRRSLLRRLLSFARLDYRGFQRCVARHGEARRHARRHTQGVGIRVAQKRGDYRFAVACEAADGVGVDAFGAAALCGYRREALAPILGGGEHYQLLLCPCQSHIEHSERLGALGTLRLELCGKAGEGVEFHPALVILDAYPALGGYYQVVPQAAVAVCLLAVAENADGEFKPLALMYRHYANGVRRARGIRAVNVAAAFDYFIYISYQPRNAAHALEFVGKVDEAVEVCPAGVGLLHGADYRRIARLLHEPTHQFARLDGAGDPAESAEALKERSRPRVAALSSVHKAVIY